MRNLKNFNHWVAELRTIAFNAKLYNEGSTEPMTMNQIIDLFNKAIFEDDFREGLTPQEAFDEEMEEWRASL